ncbi:MAG TPA: hypothetical protein VGL17_09385 [Gemmatimonadaceae bacterium]
MALAVPLLPAVAAAEENHSSASVAAVDAQLHDALVSYVARVENDPQARARLLDEKDKSGWSVNFTPVLVTPHNNYRLGGGVDPELKYTLDRGGVRLSAGLRVGAYYAKNLFGITTMPTLRLMVPVGPVEPYVSFGMGYGWLPKIEQSGIATMSRLGVVFRFSESIGIGVEGTIQKIEGSDFGFPSFGSALALNF